MTWVMIFHITSAASCETDQSKSNKLFGSTKWKD